MVDSPTRSESDGEKEDSLSNHSGLPSNMPRDISTSSHTDLQQNLLELPSGEFTEKTVPSDPSLHCNLCDTSYKHQAGFQRHLKRKKHLGYVRVQQNALQGVLSAMTGLTTFQQSEGSDGSPQKTYVPVEQRKDSSSSTAIPGQSTQIKELPQEGTTSDASSPRHTTPSSEPPRNSNTTGSIKDVVNTYTAPGTLLNVLNFPKRETGTGLYNKKLAATGGDRQVKYCVGIKQENLSEEIDKSKETTAHPTCKSEECTVSPVPENSHDVSMPKTETGLQGKQSAKEATRDKGEEYSAVIKQEDINEQAEEMSTQADESGECTAFTLKPVIISPIVDSDLILKILRECDTYGCDIQCKYDTHGCGRQGNRLSEIPTTASVPSSSTNITTSNLLKEGFSELMYGSEPDITISTRSTRTVSSYDAVKTTSESSAGVPIILNPIPGGDVDPVGNRKPTSMEKSFGNGPSRSIWDKLQGLESSTESTKLSERSPLTNKGNQISDHTERTSSSLNCPTFDLKKARILVLNKEPPPNQSENINKKYSSLAIVSSSGTKTETGKSCIRNFNSENITGSNNSQDNQTVVSEKTSKSISNHVTPDNGSIPLTKPTGTKSVYPSVDSGLFYVQLPKKKSKVRYTPFWKRKANDRKKTGSSRPDPPESSGAWTDANIAPHIELENLKDKLEKDLQGTLQGTYKRT